MALERKKMESSHPAEENILRLTSFQLQFQAYPNAEITKCELAFEFLEMKPSFSSL